MGALPLCLIRSHAQGPPPTSRFLSSQIIRQLALLKKAYAAAPHEETNTPAIGTNDPKMCYRRGFEQELGKPSAPSQSLDPATRELLRAWLMMATRVPATACGEESTPSRARPVCLPQADLMRSRIVPEVLWALERVAKPAAGRSRIAQERGVISFEQCISPLSRNSNGYSERLIGSTTGLSYLSSRPVQTVASHDGNARASSSWFSARDVIRDLELDSKFRY